MLRNIKMKSLHFSAFLIACACLASSVAQNASYCFKFTWTAALVNDDATLTNCSVITTSPCTYPVIITGDLNPPNTTAMWVNKEYEKMCTLSSDNVCIKYTYSFNDQIVNITHYCGKIIESKTSPITTGCFEQDVNGFNVEACACRSRNGQQPCNSSIKIYSSILATIYGVSIAILNSILY